MTSRVEILDGKGFRSDGRRQHELRDIKIDLGSYREADGSAVLTHGLTQVAVSVLGPREAKMRSQTMHDRANINVDVNIAAFSLGEWRKRSRADRRTLELAATIKSTFEPVIQTNLYPRSQIDIFILILQQDGAILQSCINCTALAIACAGIPMLDLISAVAVGVHVTSPLLDLTMLEENDIPNLTVAIMPRTGKVTLLTLETRLHADRFKDIIMLASDACKVVHSEMKEALRVRASAWVNVTDFGGDLEGVDTDNEHG